LHSTYAVDPRFARYFTAGWTGLLAFFVVLSVPRLYRSIRTGRVWEGIGFWEKAGGYRSIQEKPQAERPPDPPSVYSKPIGAIRALVHGPTLFSIPKTRVDVGESMSDRLTALSPRLNRIPPLLSDHNRDLLWHPRHMSACSS
jgi:ferric-chelate reductase